MEKEWEEEQKRKVMGLSKEESDEEDPSELITVPTICGICDQKFKNPIITRCEHIFCEKCALMHYSKSKLCFSCNKPTEGIFNNAQKELQKLRDAFLKAESERPANKRRKLDSPEEKGDSDDQVNDRESSLAEGEEAKSRLKEKNKFKEVTLDDDEDDVGNLIYITKQFEKQSKKQKLRFKSESDWML